jgi:hypothetical protein
MRTKSARLALTLALLLPLAACTTTTGGGATKAALCDQFAPIRWSASDTVETIRQAKEANAVGAALCGWKP